MKDFNNIKTFKLAQIPSENVDISRSMGLLSLGLGIIGIIFTIKYCLWLSLLFSITSLINKRKGQLDLRQRVSSVGFPLLALFIYYTNPGSPILEFSFNK